MRALTISKNSLFLRFYFWVWETNTEQVSLCKLFWGTVFFPLALMTINKYHLIWRIIFIWLIGIKLWSIFSLWAMVLIYIALATGFMILDILVMIQEEKAYIPVETTQVESVTLDWIFDHLIEPILFLYDDAADSGAGKRLSGFFSVLVEYFRYAKQRLCPFIWIV